MSRDRQELRAVRHYPKRERAKATRAGLLLTALLIMVVSSGCTQNPALVAKINGAYGTSFADSAAAN